MKSIFFILATFFSLSLHAQAVYEVKRDSVGFYMLSNSGQTRFDTAQVIQTIAKKREEQTAIDNEITLLERLVLLRRQAAANKNDETTLLDILEKARKCKYEK